MKHTTGKPLGNASELYIYIYIGVYYNASGVGSTRD